MKLTDALSRLIEGGHFTFTRAPEGLDALVVADLARAHARLHRDAPAAVLHVARDGERMAALERALAFFAPDVEVLAFPAWDCLPYDRSSPTSSITARRMTTLARLVRTKQGDKPRVVIATVNAAVQRVATRSFMGGQSLSMAPGNALDTKHLTEWLEHNGFLRAGTVRDTGEYAVRGGIVDLFPPGLAEPVRLDFFGDTLESIRPFDPETQRSTGQLKALDLVPTSEVQLTTESIRRFRQNYVALFGTPDRGDVLYEAVSEGRRHPGLEHWLPLFHLGLETLFDHLPGAVVTLDPLVDEAVTERLTQVADYHDARQEALTRGEGAYRPVPADRLYLTPDDWRAQLEARGTARLTPFETTVPEPVMPGLGPGIHDLTDESGKKHVDGRTKSGHDGVLATGNTVDVGGRQGRDFAPERGDPNANVFDAAVGHVEGLKLQGKRVILAAWSEGARERLGAVMEDHGLVDIKSVGRFADAQKLPPRTVALAVLGLEHGFETDDFAVMGEQDILGDRLVRGRRKAKRAQDFLTEVTSLSAGDIVVHVDHGIGRFVGLTAIDVAGAPHDCLELHYHGGSKLFLPVENIELLSRYGSEDAEAVLDRLGGAGWQQRKAKLKQRIREMAGELIKIAAARITKEAPRLTMPDGLYDEFAARFPYDETEDQQTAIDAVLDDLASGRPMDRLVCGDVGFGKTEVALRAAFATVMNGKQVAVVVPTTLLARQHHKTFVDRFRGLPVTVSQASRFVTAADMKKTKEGLADGSVEIVVGTHALLGKAISFKDLGLVIVDEEQHFGVAHKEKLKQLRAEVHVLTLTATPIPRTLQLALTGVRELSLITTPPVDRLTVRTFIAPFDPLTVREALLRERYRGGQSFFVCPRIDDIAEVRHFLEAQVPEVKVAVGHGQMAAGELEDVMTDFYDGKFDVLLSTSIVESGLDIPNANTLVVYRADMFGLAALYQLRGRVGRAKTRAYALFTTPDSKKPISANAERRLKVLQSLDTLGAGFQLASHDLDIRGAGNLLGDEQSGHIREVGYELYQQMLEEAVASLRDGVDDTAPDQWSPQIGIGTPVLIPETYIEDLTLRLGLDRRLAGLETEEEINAFAAELADRFGPRPEEVEHLLKVMAIKGLCRRANIEKVDAGPKGVVLSLRDNSFANPEELVRYISKEGANAKIRPDMKIVLRRDWDRPVDRLQGTRSLLRDLVKIAEMKKAA